MRTRKRILRSPIGRGLVWLLVVHIGLLHVLPVLALPQGQQVSHGDVTFETTGDTMVVQQASGSAIVNYGSFNIAQPETVRFIQPGSSAAILNRVRGGSSTIAGNSALQRALEMRARARSARDAGRSAPARWPFGRPACASDSCDAPPRSSC